MSWLKGTAELAVIGVALYGINEFTDGGVVCAVEKIVSNGHCIRGGAAIGGEFNIEGIDRKKTIDDTPVTLGAELQVGARATGTFDIRVEGWRKYLETYAWKPGSVASTIFYNKGNDKVTTGLVDACTGGTIEGSDIPNNVKPSNGAYTDRPVSPIRYTFTYTNGELNILYDTGPLGLCNPRITNAQDQPGGADNENLWGEANGGAFQSNNYPASINAARNAAAPLVNQLLIDEILAGACPEENTNAAALRRIVAESTEGQLLKSFKSDPALYNGILDAYDKSAENYDSGRVIVRLGDSAVRQAAAQAKLVKDVAKYNNTVYHPIKGVTFTMHTNVSPVTKQCGQWQDAKK